MTSVQGGRGWWLRHRITADHVEVRVDRESQAAGAASAVQHTIDVANGDATLD